MNPLTPRQQQALACGLSVFDQACLDRNRRGRAWRGGGVVAILVGVTVALYTAGKQQATPLPAYVRIMTSDAQVIAELELANACERIERAKGRVVVVECVVPELVPSVDGGRRSGSALR